MRRARIQVFALALAAGLAAAPAGLAARQAPGSPLRAPRVERGIVQSVSAGAVVLKELDGTTVTIAVDFSTHVLVNGQAATLADVRPGAVVAVLRRPRGAALEIRAVDSSPRARPVVDRGVVQSVSATSVVLRRADGTSLSIAVGPATRVLVNGQPAAVAAIAPGMRAAAKHVGSRPARVLRAFGRRAR